MRAASRYAKTTRLVVSSDQAYAASVMVALDAHHIPYLDQPAGTPWGPATAVVVRELDVRRAREAIRDLQRTTSSSNPPPVRVLAALVIVLILVGIAIGVITVVADLLRG